MLFLGLKNTHMELGFNDLFTSYDMELGIGNQPGLTNNETELGFSEQFTS